jgi:hypothetical protein
MKWLTKSDYLKYLIHPAYLWLQKYDKDKLPPFDEATQAIVDAGNEIEGYARGLFEEGVMVQSLFQDSVRETEKYVKEDKPVIFQAAVLTERRLYAKADVLTRNADGSWDLHEVKSSTKEKPEHIHDLAFQRNAFELSGYKIRRTHLIHINSQYVRRGQIDPAKLFTSIDVTEKVEEIMDATRRRIEEALDVMALPNCPDDGIEGAKNWYAWRDVYRHLHPDLPADSILNLTRLDLPQVKQLAKAGATTFAEIPANFELKPQQAAQLEAIKAGHPIIYPVKILNHMRKLQFPLYFFDYETVGGGLPLYDGTKPYQQVPFQYSLHILRRAGAELEHKEFLATDRRNPMPALLHQMQRDIGEEGSVVVWFKGFEGGVNQMMSQIYPEYSAFLKGVNRRMYDLMEIFSNTYYNDAAFGGSASIKNVLPVLVPELSYKGLAIGKGDVAQRRWEQAAFGKLSDDEAQQVYADLRLYCGQDTLAMVKIYDVLMNVRESAPGAQMSLLS